MHTRVSNNVGFCFERSEICRITTESELAAMSSRLHERHIELDKLGQLWKHHSVIVAPSTLIFLRREIEEFWKTKSKKLNLFQKLSEKLTVLVLSPIDDDSERFTRSNICCSRGANNC